MSASSCLITARMARSLCSIHHTIHRNTYHWSSLRNLSGSSRRRGRNPASFRYRKHQESKKKEQQQQVSSSETRSNIFAEAVKANAVENMTTIAPSSSSSSTPSSISSMALLQFLQKWILPVRYRSSDTTTTFYTRQHALAVVWRFPLWLLLAAMLSWDERINPYNIIRITGPSMIPTCAPDGTDIWLKVSWNKTLWFRLLHHLFPSVFKMSYQSGDLIGLSHPDHPHHVSCKRVIGVEGDTVQRYGQYVHLFEDQDPQHLGMTWPSAKEQVHAWIDRQCLWDTGNKTDDVAVAPDSRRTLVVPEKSLWVEGDCPGLAIDSRQYGPIPLDWIQGKLVGRIWPFWRKESGELPRRTRPHPVALDDETLQQFNVHIRPSTTS